MVDKTYNWEKTQSGDLYYNMQSLFRDYISPAWLVFLRETIDNALECGARNISIRFIENNGFYYIGVEHDGQPMDIKTLFHEYRKTNLSTKRGDDQKSGHNGVGRIVVLGAVDEDGNQLQVRIWGINCNPRAEYPIAGVAFKNYNARKNNPWDLEDQIFDSVVSPNFPVNESKLFGELPTKGVRSIVGFAEKNGLKLWKNAKRNAKTTLEKVYLPTILDNTEVTITVDGQKLEQPEYMRKDFSKKEKVSGKDTEFVFYTIEDPKLRDLPPEDLQEVYNTLYGFGGISYSGKVISSLFSEKPSSFEDAFLHSVDRNKIYNVYCLVKAHLKGELNTSKEKLRPENVNAQKWIKGVVEKVKNYYKEQYPSTASKSKRQTTGKMDIFTLNHLKTKMAEMNIFRNCHLTEEQRTDLHNDLVHGLSKTVKDRHEGGEGKGASTSHEFEGKRNHQKDKKGRKKVQKTDKIKTGRTREERHQKEGTDGYAERGGNLEGTPGDPDLNNPNDPEGVASLGSGMHNPLREIRYEYLTVMEEVDGVPTTKPSTAWYRLDEDGCRDGEKNLIINIGEQSYVDFETETERTERSYLIVAIVSIALAYELGGHEPTIQEQTENMQICAEYSKNIGGL